MGDSDENYNRHVEAFRKDEYPMLKGNRAALVFCRSEINIGLDAIYLDHAGTTLYSKSLMENFMADMMSNLYGNPHAASPSSQLSSNRIEDVRLKTLQFFKADPENFDVVFVANATAGIKLVMDAFQGTDGGFNYAYHISAHTSLIGVREGAVSSCCVRDEDVKGLLSGSKESFLEHNSGSLDLFAYPAQSNLDGRRLPMSWAHEVRSSALCYTLLDASAFVSTSQLDLSDVSKAPDFTVLSFYKIFGFPDLGALIVRKESASVFRERKYFGGGTVDLVLCSKEQWHVPKVQSLHDSLEDGTLPIHSIMALDSAFDTHRKLYASMDKVSKHTTYLAQRLYSGLACLKHGNSRPVCIIYSNSFSSNNAGLDQGPVIAFNLRNSHGAWISNVEFEKLASVRNIHIRTGVCCNPGGIAASLKLEAWEMRRNFSAGHKCDSENDIYSGKITGVIRASIGPMTILSDVETFLSFIQEFYVEEICEFNVSTQIIPHKRAEMQVESLTVYPIKSCGGFQVPANTDWEVRPEGLIWDREWCLVHQGTGQALSQKRYPRMALIRPVIDFKAGVLRVHYFGELPPGVAREISIPLSANPTLFTEAEARSVSSRVCGDAIIARTYAVHEINNFFSTILNITCSLARFPAGGSGPSTRHAKAHMQKHQRPKGRSTPGIVLPESPLLTPPDSDSEIQKRPILLANESPILAISRVSLDALNSEIAKTGGKAAAASVFRANIVLASASLSISQQPYSEDHWSILRIGHQEFQMLGSCRRCHMICVNQDTAEKDSEPFITLAKTRRYESKVFFGSHMCHIQSKGPTKENQCPTIRVGDVATVQS